MDAKSKRVKISESSSREMQRAIEEIVHGPDVARQMRRERERAVTPPAPGDVYVELADMPQGMYFFLCKLWKSKSELVLKYSRQINDF